MTSMAALWLIRSSTACGDLGDVVGDQLSTMHPPPTVAAAARFSMPGEVIDVKSA
jgi:hypothetical protein